MGKSQSDMEEAIMEAARRVVEESRQFWGLDAGSLTLQGLIAEGKGPLSYPGPDEFVAAVEMLAIGTARAQREARQAEEPPPEPSEQEMEDQAWAEYEARVASTHAPEELAAIVRENEALLSEEAHKDRLEVRRRAERSFQLREDARRREATVSGGITEQDWATQGAPDRNVERAKRTSRSRGLPSDPDELYRLWKESGGKIPGPEGD